MVLYFQKPSFSIGYLLSQFITTTIENSSKIIAKSQAKQKNCLVIKFVFIFG